MSDLLDRLSEEAYDAIRGAALSSIHTTGQISPAKMEKVISRVIRRTAAAIREEDAKIAMTTPFHRVCEQHIGEIGLLFQGCKEIAEAIKNQTL